MTMTSDEITSKDYDLLLNRLCPWGSLDVWHMVKHAESCGIDMYELAEILQDQAESFCINLYENSTDVNALLNDYILDQARQDIEDNTDIDILEYDVYYYANYLDCPLQYSDKCVEELEKAIEEKELTKDDFNKYALYVLEDMGISL